MNFKGFFSEETTPIHSHLLQDRVEDDQLVADRAQTVAGRLLHLGLCAICRQPFDLNEKMPRVAVQCGHTFCTCCLASCIHNRVLRCPQCLAKLNGISSVHKLPVNSAAFAQISKREKLEQKLQEREQEESRAQNQSRQSCDLVKCEIHPAETKHLYCVKHKTTYCKLCAIHHQKNESRLNECRMLDVCQIEEEEDYSQYLQEGGS